MAEPFDAYHKWLGIPPKDQPPHHYRLLGIELFEPDADVIDAAANRVSAYLEGCNQGAHSAHLQKLLEEVAAARRCLLDAARKALYDDELRRKTGQPKNPRGQRGQRQGAPAASQASADTEAPFSLNFADAPAPAKRARSAARSASEEEREGPELEGIRAVALPGAGPSGDCGPLPCPAPRRGSRRSSGNSRSGRSSTASKTPGPAWNR